MRNHLNINYIFDRASGFPIKLPGITSFLSGMSQGRRN
jgi:hypothetical protein